MSNATEARVSTYKGHRLIELLYALVVMDILYRQVENLSVTQARSCLCLDPFSITGANGF